MPAKTTQIAVVDDDADVRDSLAVLLETAGYAVTQFGDAFEFLDREEAHAAACAVVDVNMPDMGGLQLQQEIKRLGLGIPVIIVTGNGDIPLAVRAMQAGAVDFIEKPVDQVHLLESVRKALAMAVEQKQSEADAADAARRIDLLTPREKEVLKLIALGHPNKVIGHELDISPRTVEVHRARLMDKTQAKTVSDLVRWSMAAGLLSD